MEARTLQDIFVGREHEQQLYHDFLTHDEAPWVLIITGLSGIGKSTLLDHLAKATSSSLCACKLDFNEALLRTEPLIVLQRLAQQLSLCGYAQQVDAFEQTLQRHLDQIEQIRQKKLPPSPTDEANSQEVFPDSLEDDAATKEIGRQMRELSTALFYDLINTLRLNHLVLMLDTCEWFNESEGWEVGQWVFNELIPEIHNRLLCNDQRCSVVVVSRVKPQLGRIDKQDQQHLPLSMLSEKAVYEYLERAGMHDPELRQRVYDITHGHALSISIIGTICQEQGEKSLAEEDWPLLQKAFTEKASMEFVDERILHRLRSPYRELTRYGVLLRSFNLPLLQAVFSDLDAIKGPDAPDIFDHLIRYPFIESRGNYTYAFHELLREVIAEKVQQQEGPEKERWKTYHKQALEYFQRVAPSSPDWYYHALAADEGQGMKAWLQAIQKASASQRKALLQITYDSALKLSPAAGAVRDYEQGRFNYGSIEWLNATGNVQQAHEKRKEALKSFEHALKNFKEAQDSCGEALAQVAIDALQRTGKAQTAALKSYWLVCLPPTRNPYKGLRPFTLDDARDYFGHDLLVNELMTRLQEELTADKERLLAVVGPSGSGKSSVLMAGLLPRLQAGALPGSKQWVYLKPLVPGQHPLESLALTLAPCLPDRSLKSIREDLQGTSTGGLHLLATLLAGDSEGKVVLFVDQFEELFTQTASEDERRHFIDLLVTALQEPHGPLVVLLTLRADFYDRPMLYPILGNLLRQTHSIVLPMDVAELRAVIEKPAALPDVQLMFEGNLVSDLLLEIQGQAGALPLLQFTLDQLYQRRSGHQLTLQAYQEIGGVKGALAKHAEDTFASLPSDEHRRLARALFLRLTDLGITEQDTTRRRVPLPELSLPDPAQSAMLRETADAFITARLLITNEAEDITTIEVSHEALIREWTRLTIWLLEAREDISTQQIITQDVGEWERRNKPRDRLYRGTQLREAKAWAARDTPSEREMAFLRASKKYQTLRRVGVIVASLLLLTGGLLTGGFAWETSRQQLRSNSMRVMTLQDNNENGSLRWCIDHAPSGSTIITFAPGMRGTINLKEDRLEVTSGKQITINGPGANQLAISGSKYTTINVDQGATLNISDLSVKNSETFEWPILYNQGTLTLAKSFITGNKTISTESLGGGIYNAGTGTLRVTNSTISNNSSTTIYNKSFSAGGGIYNSGQLTVTNSTISNNTARIMMQEGSGYGGGIYNSKTGALTVTNSTFSGNSSNGDQGGQGGGIGNEGKLTVTNSTFSKNTASSSNRSYGGGIDNLNTGKLTVTNSTFSGNSSSGKQEEGQGGGINNSGQLTVTQSTFSNNRASGDRDSFGGGISNYQTGTVLVTSSTLSNNSSSGKQGGQGGGIDNQGQLSVITSTFWDNTASGGSDTGGGGISFTGVNKDAFTTVRFSTLYGNTSRSAGGGIWVDPIDIGVMRISDNIVAANSARDGPNISDIPGKLTSDGYNLSDNFAGAKGLNARTDRQVKLADLKINPTLGNNGGSTQTLALLPGSPAIGAVPGQACSTTITDASGHTMTITTDERGISRLNRLKNACDSGAYQSPN